MGYPRDRAGTLFSAGTYWIASLYCISFAWEVLEIAFVFSQPCYLVAFDWEWLIWSNPGFHHTWPVKAKFTVQNLYLDVQCCRMDRDISPWLPLSFAPSRMICCSYFLLPWHLIGFVLVFTLAPWFKIGNSTRPKINPGTNPWVTSFHPDTSLNMYNSWFLS